MKEPIKPREAGKPAAKKSAASAGQKPDSPVELVTLRLYIAGQTPKSLAALANLKRLCADHLPPQYKIELEVVDLMATPARAVSDQILAIPTLVRNLPTPIKKIIGDLSNTERVLHGLDIRVS